MVRAASDTAIRPVIFSSALCRIGAVTVIARDRTWEAWKVPTMGPSAAQQASSPSDGAAGSWTCRTSKPPSLIQRRTRAADRKPNASRATDPL